MRDETGLKILTATKNARVGPDLFAVAHSGDAKHSVAVATDNKMLLVGEHAHSGHLETGEQTSIMLLDDKRLRRGRVSSVRRQPSFAPPAFRFQSWRSVSCGHHSQCRRWLHQVLRC